MKILLASNSYPTPEYPLQAFIGVLCRELVRQGHEVTVIAPCMVLHCLRHRISIDKKHYYDEFEFLGEKKKVEVYRPRIIAPGTGNYKKIVSWICQKRMSAVALKMKREFDVVYAHFWSSAINLKDYVQKTNSPLIVACGEDKMNLTYLRSKNNIATINCLTSGVICVSSKNKDESIKAGLTNDEKCIILPNAVDSGEFYKLDKWTMRRELGFPLNAFIVVFLGRFNERKGIRRVSEAIRRCNDDTIKVIYIGNGSSSEKKSIEGPEVIFAGTLVHSDVVRYLNAADVFVLPTLAEGCSNAIVEAMACGLPIISSNLPFNNDILNETNAILIDPMDIEQIEKSLKILKQDDMFRKKLAEGALLSARELTIEKRVSKIIKFIEYRINKNG